MKSVWKKLKVGLPLLGLGLAMVGCSPAYKHEVMSGGSVKGSCGTTYKASCAKPMASKCGVKTPCVKPIVIKQKPILVTQPTLVVKQPTIRVKQPAIRVKNPPVIIEQPQVMVKPPSIRVEPPKVLVEKPRITVERPTVSFRKPDTCKTGCGPQPVMVSKPVMMQKPEMAEPAAAMVLQKK
jgi:hypothetical protein